MRSLLLLCFALLFASLPACAEAVFDFSTLPNQTPVPFTLSSDGITASFGSYVDFVTMPSFFSFPGSVLLDFSFSGTSLDIGFSQQISSLSFNFGTGDLGSTLLIDAYNGFLVPPTRHTFTSHPVPIGNAEGYVNLTGNFNAISIYDPDPTNCPELGQPDCDGNNFAIGTLYADTAATPEPTSLILLGTGLLGAVQTLRRRSTSARNSGESLPS